MLIIVTPYVTTMIIIIITGDRIEGMNVHYETFDDKVFNNGIGHSDNLRTLNCDH